MPIYVRPNSDHEAHCNVLNRLSRISRVAAGQTVASFSYQYNDANQRTQRTDADGSYWVYQYDSLGQVTSDKKYWADGSPVGGVIGGVEGQAVENDCFGLIEGGCRPMFADALQLAIESFCGKICGLTRMARSVAEGTNSATYVYVANSPLVSQILFTNRSAQRMVTTKQYDLLNRLTNIASVASSQTVASFSYQYNDANQRTQRTDADGSYWVYQYDPLGQVTSGKKHWADGSQKPVAGGSK